MPREGVGKPCHHDPENGQIVKHLTLHDAADTQTEECVKGPTYSLSVLIAVPAPICMMAHAREAKRNTAAQVSTR